MTDAGEIAARWRAVAKRFPVWRFLFDLLFDPNSWRLIGADVTTMVLQSGNARAAARELEGASPETLTALTSIAAVNVARANDVFRAVILGYVSIPLALAALLTDAAPEALQVMVNEHAPSIVLFLIGSLVFPILYFCGAWRAKQIAWVIDLFRAGALTPPDKAKRNA